MTKRVPLFSRLPEIYRTKDAEQLQPNQLRDYLAVVEAAFGAIHENIDRSTTISSSRPGTTGSSLTSAISSARPI